MRGRPVFDRTDLAIVMPDGERRRIVVYHENDHPGAVLDGWDEADRVGGRLEIMDTEPRRP